jgi:transcription factor SPN1
LDEDGRPVRKRKRRPVVEEDLSQLPPEQGTPSQLRDIHHNIDLAGGKAAKMKLDMQIEAILKPKKGNRTKRKKNADEELDRYADEEVSRLREAMLAAAADDELSNKQKLPATAKLKLLPQVLDILRK